MAQGRASGKRRDKYRVKLTADERDELRQLVRKGKAAGWKLTRARALLKCDESKQGPAPGTGRPDTKIAEALDVTTRRLEKWRRQAVERGPLSLLQRKKRDRSMDRKLDGAGEPRWVQRACSTPPAGDSRGSLRLLADKLVELKAVDSIGHECVRQTLQKTR